jgi:transposase
MTAVMIGVDPHKGSHTAVVTGPAEEPLGEIRVRASAAQAGKLTGWAAAWPERTWAVEGAAGMGRLLDWQLVAAGERVLDVQPKLASRVRLLQAGDTNKNDPNDALPVAVAALRSRTCRQVAAEDHPAVLKVRAERHRDLARLRNQVACRLHAVLCDLVPGGIAKEISAAQAARILGQATPSGAVALARAELAAEFPGDMRRLDAQLRGTRKKLAAAVKASGTTLTQVFGVGPVIASTIIGDIADVSRFPGRDHFASYNGTAPAGVSSGNRKARRLSLRGNRRINHAIHMAAITWIRHQHSDGRTCYEKKLAEGKTHKEALRSLKRRISDAIYARLLADARRAGQQPAPRAREGQPGNDSDSSAAGSRPERRLFGQATPGPGTSLRPGTTTGTSSKPARRKPRQLLDTHDKEDSIWMLARRTALPRRPRRKAYSVAPCPLAPGWIRPAGMHQLAPCTPGPSGDWADPHPESGRLPTQNLPGPGRAGARLAADGSATLRAGAGLGTGASTRCP